MSVAAPLVVNMYVCARVCVFYSVSFIFYLRSVASPSIYIATLDYFSIEMHNLAVFVGEEGQKVQSKSISNQA